MADDIINAYLRAPTSEKHFIICDSELHGIDHAGKQSMVVRALCGGKLAGRYLWVRLCVCIDTLGFTSCFSDPDLWMRKSKREDGKDYYGYVILYVDDCLVISDNAESFIRA